MLKREQRQNNRQLQKRQREQKKYIYLVDNKKKVCTFARCEDYKPNN